MVSVVLALETQPTEETVAGRQSSSAQNLLRKLIPLTFQRVGAATVSAFGGRLYNLGNTPLVVQRVHASAVTAPVGSALVVDVKINGTSVFAAAGDRISIAAGENAAEGRPTKTGDAITVKPGQYVTCEFTAIGSGTAGSDVNVAVVLG